MSPMLSVISIVIKGKVITSKVIISIDVVSKNEKSLKFKFASELNVTKL